MKITSRTLSSRYNVKVSEALKTGRTYQTKWYNFYKKKGGIWYRVQVGRRRFSFRSPREEQSIGWIVNIERYLPRVIEGDAKYRRVMKRQGHITERRYIGAKAPFRITTPPVFGNVFATYWSDIVATQVDSENKVWMRLDCVLRRNRTRL